MTKAPVKVKVQKIKTDLAMTNEDPQDKNLSLYPVKDVSIATNATNNTTATKVRDVDAAKLSLKESILISNEVPRRSILRTSTTNNESGSFNTREVSFDSIRIRNYRMELGNHPNCQVGAPVTLSWDYEEQGTQDIDLYEFERKPRRRMRHLILNYYRRNDILKLAGYSDKELKAAEKAVAQVQRQRQATVTFLPVRQLGELIGSTARKVTRVGRRNSSSE
jgi:hypothetical protein